MPSTLVPAVDFEYAPPLDPATLFIDLDPRLTADAQRAFVCEVLAPRVKAANAEIAVSTNAGGRRRLLTLAS